MSKKPLPGQSLLPDPLLFPLRQAWEKFHRQPDHSTGHVRQTRTALDHWERCTSNPPLADIDNAVMLEFRTRFLSEPLPSKVARLSAERLAALAPGFGRPPAVDHYRAVRELIQQTDPLPEALRWLLPRPTSFNSVRGILEGIFSTLGPKTHGQPFALGLLNHVPRCRPAKEDEPRVVVAREEELTRFYEQCAVATWPFERVTGVPPAAVWRALLVYLYNLASRRGDFLGLRKDQVNLDACTAEFRQGKTKKQRTLPLHPIVVAHFRAIWDAPGELVFPFPRSGQLLYGQWRTIQRAAGIHVPRSPGEQRHQVYCFHEIRKTSLTEYFGLNERASQMLGCHSDMATQIRHYIAAAKQDGVLRQASAALHQPLAFASLAPPPDPAPEPPGDRPRPRLRVVG